VRTYARVFVTERESADWQLACVRGQRVGKGRAAAAEGGGRGGEI
jgi:hypothetical protein